MSDDFSLIFNKALKFLNFRPRSEKEMVDYLTKKGASDDVKNKIVDKLKHLNFINDEEFVNWWIERRFGSRPRGVAVVKQELLHMGVDRDLIERQLSVYRVQFTERELAERFAQKKMEKLVGLPIFEVKRKLYSALSGRGFNYEIIKDTVDKIFKKE